MAAGRKRSINSCAELADKLVIVHPQRNPTDHLSTLFQGSECICVDRSGGGGHEITERLSGYHGWF